VAWDTVVNAGDTTADLIYTSDTLDIIVSYYLFDIITVSAAETLVTTETGTTSVTLDSLKIMGVGERSDTVKVLIDRTIYYPSAVEKVIISVYEQTITETVGEEVHAWFQKIGWSGDTTSELAVILVPQTSAVLEDTVSDTLNISLADEYVLVVTSDYSTGAYSAITLNGNIIQNDIDNIHSDAVVRFGNGEIVILNRMGRDNIQIVSKKTYETVLQFSTGANSNPYDAAFYNGQIYVLKYALAEIGIYDQQSGTEAGTIDISSFADSDGIPEAAGCMIIQDHLYVITQNLARDNWFAATDTGWLIKIDMSKNTVVDSLLLVVGNPRSMDYDSSTGILYVSLTGTFFNASFAMELDGLVQAINISDFSTAKYLVSEADLNGTITAGRLYGDYYYAAVNGADSKDHLVKVRLSDGWPTKIADSDAYKLMDLAIDRENGRLYLADMKNGVRIFNLSDDSEASRSNIDVGLPPFSLIIVK
jgi:hypothetical protein